MDHNDKILFYVFGAVLIAVVISATAPPLLANLGKDMEHDTVKFFNWIEPLAAMVTAFGTIVLGAFTLVLARETKRLADVGEQPSIVVTFGPNRHSMSHLDMQVENTGTATAYDIQINITPELKFGRDHQDYKLPLHRISVLKSKQSLSSYFAGWSELEPKAFTVITSWLRSPAAKVREELTYDVDLGQFEGISQLGGDPVIDFADATKKIADEVGRISRGHNRLAVETFNAKDREEERRVQEERYAQMRARHSPAPAPASSDPALSADRPSEPQGGRE